MATRLGRLTTDVFPSRPAREAWLQLPDADLDLLIRLFLITAAAWLVMSRKAGLIGSSTLRQGTLPITP